MQRIPQIWPGWHADELIGRGSFGSVYRSSRTIGSHTSRAAIKVIDIPQTPGEVSELRQMGMDAASINSYFENSAQRLINEIALMDQLKGLAHVVHIEDYYLQERDDGIGWTIFIRMELLEPLPAYLEHAGPPDQHEAATIGLHLCDALRRCHELGIIHRDVKPANVFRSRFGDYKLGDFGIARQLNDSARSTKSRVGTLPYMAPEVKNGHYDASADIYSLGIMLYRWLNGGKPPFIAPNEILTQATLEQAHLRRMSGESLPLPAGEGVDPQLAALVARAVEPNPSDRWENADAFGSALKRWLEDEAEKVHVRKEPAETEWHTDHEPSEHGPETVVLFSTERVIPVRKCKLRIPANIMDLGGTITVNMPSMSYDFDRMSPHSMPNMGPEQIELAIPARCGDGHVISLPERGYHSIVDGRRGDLSVSLWREQIARRTDEGPSKSTDEGPVKSTPEDAIADYAQKVCDEFLRTTSSPDIFAKEPRIIDGLGIKNDEEVYLVHDDTWLKSGKVGFAITSKGLYCRLTKLERTRFTSWHDFLGLADRVSPRLKNVFIFLFDRSKPSGYPRDYLASYTVVSVLSRYGESKQVYNDLLQLYAKLVEYAKSITTSK